jgi:hypothetical protein
LNKLEEHGLTLDFLEATYKIFFIGEFLYHKLSFSFDKQHLFDYQFDMIKDFSYHGRFPVLIPLPESIFRDFSTLHYVCSLYYDMTSPQEKILSFLWRNKPRKSCILN